MACDAVIPTAAGKKRADELSALVPDQGWQRLSCADGSMTGPSSGTTSPDHHLLVRRPLVPDEKGGLELAYAPPAFVTDENGRDRIPLTAAESRRLFSLHVPVTHPDSFRQRWSDWRRYRRAAARKSHYTGGFSNSPEAGSPRAGPACPTSSLLPLSGHGGGDRRGS